MEDARSKSRTRYLWIINTYCDYHGWDFLWEPVPWQEHQRHAWPSQWQKDCGTYLVPKSGYDDTNYHTDRSINRLPTQDNWSIPAHVQDFDTSWHPDPTEPNYQYQFGTQWQKTGGPVYALPGADQVKYVTQVRAQGSRVADQAVMIDHSNSHDVPDMDIIKTSRYFDNYLDTLKRVAKTLPQDLEFVWILSSLCDYTDFDFTWHPEHWQQGMLHVFQSDGEKFGDTFFMHVPSFRERIDSVELLDWYDLNFVDMSIPRRPIPWIRHDDDSHVEQVKRCTLTDPLMVFQNADYDGPLPAIPLWRNKTKTVTPLTRAGSTVIVPRQAIAAVKEQLWDYEHVDKTHQASQDQPLDVVFISNGEDNAEMNYQHLAQVLRDRPNRLHRVTNVKGRVNSFHRAADATDSRWIFIVTAKLKVNAQFDFGWQPDMLQQPKHYVFHAHNPMTGLEYGHVAMVAYNRMMLYENDGGGLDFTLNQAHEVVPLLSGTVNMGNDDTVIWRTTFREVIKLKHRLSQMPDIEASHRLRKWCTQGTPASMQAANDAVEYYDSVDGEFEKLKLSYEWEWLDQYRNSLS